jgi:invasion protein IalB
MNKIATLAAVLLIGTVVGGPAAFAQNATAPNSGAGVPGLPGKQVRSNHATWRTIHCQTRSEQRARTARQ